MRNQWSFRTKSRLKVVDSAVKISKVIGKKDANGQEFYPSFTNLIVVLMSEDRRTYETTRATADGNGNLTFLKRGLSDDGSETEVAKNIRARAPGTYMYVTAGAQDFESKQDKLVAGANITIDANNEISAVDTTYTAGANISIDANNEISAVDTTYTAGTGIDITAGVISSTQTSGEWGQITGDIQDQTDLQTALSGKQDTLTAGSNITISGTTISATDTTYVASDFDIKDLTDSTSLRSTWSGKQDALVSGTNIKTVNGTSLLGSGNIQTCDVMSETDYGQITPVNGVPYFTYDE